MNNKLSLMVNFVGVDKMSGALKNIVGLGKKGSDSLRGLNGEVKRLNGEVKRYDRLMAQSSGNVTTLWNKQKALLQELEQVQARINRQQRIAAIEADRRAMIARGDELKQRGQGNMMGGAAMAIPLVAATKQAMTFEAAMADVRKVVDFPTPQAFAKMSDDVLTLSTRIPMASEGIAAIVAAAGRASVPRQELLQFAEDAAKMGVAFDISGDEAGAMMAKWRTAFAMNRTGVVALADQVNALTNSYGGNATAVAGIVTRIGALGKVAGVAAPQVAAMAQLLNSVGVEEEIAATGIKNMMLALTKGEAATKSQTKALSALGLSATDVARRMQTDASGAITDVLGRIGNLSKEQQAGILTSLFGSESVGAIAPMLTNLDKLQRNIKLVGDSTSYANSMNKEYLARIATTEGATGLAMNALKALNIELGNALLPTISAAAAKITVIATTVRSWTKEHPQLTSALVKAAVGLAAFKIGLGVAQFGLGSIIRTIGQARSVFGTASAVFGGLRTAVLFLGQGFLRAGAMMLANPIVLIITAVVVAVGAAAYLIYSHWDKIKAAFTAGVDWVKGVLSGLPGWLKNIGRLMMEGLLLAINPMALAWKLVQVAKTGITAFKNFLGIKSPSRVFMALGEYTTEGLTRGIDRGRRGPVRAVSRVAAGVAAAGAVSLTPAYGASAARGMAAQPAPAASEIHVHVHGAPGQSVDELAKAVIRKIEQMQGIKARSSYEGAR